MKMIVDHWEHRDSGTDFYKPRACLRDIQPDSLYSRTFLASLSKNNNNCLCEGDE